MQDNKIGPDFTEQDKALFTGELIDHMEGLTNENQSINSKSQLTKDTYEITAEELLNKEIETIPCLIEPIFQAVGLATVAGSSDVGKSAFLRQLAVSVATGQPTFLGWAIRAVHHSVIYVSTEDDENATAFLLCSLNKSQNLNPSLYSRLRFVFYTNKLLVELDQRLTKTPADLVIIDAFMDLFGEDANSSSRIRNFLNEYQQLAQKHKCLFIWLHHTGKRTDDLLPSKHNLIGGQGFEGKMRLVIELRRDWHDPERRHFCIVKGNYLPDSEKEDSHVLTWDGTTFTFEMTSERVPFDQLGRPRENEDEGKRKYEKIQAARAKDLKGQALSDFLKMSKGQISKLEKRYTPQNEDEAKVSR